jgi:hypothetical protein
MPTLIKHAGMLFHISYAGYEDKKACVAAEKLAGRGAHAEKLRSYADS